MVWNAEKSILEVEDFIQAITTSAQTALRESIGRHELAQMITERESMGRELQKILDAKTNPWGITVQSVKGLTRLLSSPLSHCGDLMAFANAISAHECVPLP